MTTTTTAKPWWRALPLLVLLLLVGLGSRPTLAGPGMPDPRQMSGIPRPDPQIAAGEITVRVLRGGFDSPALGEEVRLELRSADGRTVELRRLQTGNQGRAHFRELQAFAGGQAVARVQLDGETISSQQIEVRADVGTAVMLVAGAPKGTNPLQDVSLPGIVFPREGEAGGTLTVGVFDLQERKPLVDLEVQLVVRAPDGETSSRSAKTADMGRAVFEGLRELPAGTVLQVQAQLEPEGEPHRSMEFEVDPEHGMVVTLMRGRMPDLSPTPPAAGGDPHAPKRVELPPPQIVRSLPVGTVQLRIVDGKDQPVADHPVTIVKKDFAGTETRFETSTDDKGMATQADLPVVTDALYYVGISYDGAPYTSRFFGLDKRGGVVVAMRVWPVTSDRSVARSAVQFELVEGENDTAQVIQVYEVLVGGEEAFWPGDEPLRIEGLEGAKGMVVLRGAEEWLDHEDKAPYAVLSHPIPPGEVAALSVGYILDGHGGEVVIEWTPPFQLIESALVMSDALTLDAPGAKPSDRELPERPGLDYTRVAYELGQQGTGPVQATVTGLRQTEKVFGWIAMTVSLLVLGVVTVALAVAPHRNARQRLEQQRDQLLAALERTRDPAKRKRMVVVLDRIYRKIDALDALQGADRPRAGATGT